MAPRRKDLGTGELEVLSVLWDEGPCTVRQVLDHLHAAGRGVAYTTVLTVLTRLENKGFVASDKAGVAYLYRSTVTRERVRKSRLRSLVSELYDGAAGPLVLQLIKSERFSTEEIEELRALLERLDDKRET